MEKIRLGYPGKIQNVETGQYFPQGWFWGERGESIYHFWTDSNYEKAKKSNFCLKFTIDIANERGDNLASKLYSDLCLDFNRYSNYFEWCEYKDYIKGQKTFLVPISIDVYDITEIGYLTKVKIPADLCFYIKAGKAKVLFFCLMDPYVLPEREKILVEFCKNNDLTRKDVFVFTSNFSSTLNRESKYYQVRCISYFSEDIWFTPVSNFSNKVTNLQLNRQITSEYLMNTKFFRTFVCLNRREDTFRKFVAGFLRFSGISSYVSLGSTERLEVTGNDLAEDIEISRYRKSRYSDLVLEGYRKLGKSNGLMTLDLSPGMMKNGAEIISPFCTKAFCTIVTDTVFDWHTNEIQFLSEKVFKPMYYGRPFILVSTPGCLGLLHTLGFETFDRWWDESYDKETDNTVRLDKILGLVQYIDSWSFSKKKQVLQEMKPILQHNAKRLIYTLDIKHTLKWLSSEIYT